MTAARTCAPSQHLSKKVLHFVCELRGLIIAEHEGWMPASVGMTNWGWRSYSPERKTSGTARPLSIALTRFASERAFFSA
jgi:hypothetical protein